DHDSTQEQLTLFAPHKTDEQKETNKRELSSKRESSSATIEKKPGARTKKSASYSAADIQVLEGIAAIRHRPGMYIGSTSTSGLRHLNWEDRDDAVAEADAGAGKHVVSVLDHTGRVVLQ